MSEPVRQLVVILLQVFTGYLPQAIGFLMFVYFYCNRRLDKIFWIGVLLLAAACAVIRMMPIAPGICTLFIIIILILLSVYYCKLPIVKCIVSSLLATIILSIVETCVVMAYQSVFHLDTMVLTQDALKWAIYAIPCTVIFCLIVFICYFIRMRKGGEHAEADTAGGPSDSGGTRG